MPPVNVYDAKTQLSKLLARVEQGEEIVIARAGRPIARLVPIRARAPGADRGRVSYDDGLHAPLGDDEIADWGL